MVRRTSFINASPPFYILHNIAVIPIDNNIISLDPWYVWELRGRRCEVALLMGKGRGKLISVIIIVVCYVPVASN